MRHEFKTNINKAKKTILICAFFKWIHLKTKRLQFFAEMGNYSSNGKVIIAFESNKLIINSKIFFNKTRITLIKWNLRTNPYYLFV